MIEPMNENIFFWSHYVMISLFTLGAIGVLLRRNALVVLMSIELMLNAVNLFLVETSLRLGNSEGIILVIFVVTIAAAEAAVGLGIVVNLYRIKGNVEINSFSLLQG